MNFPDGHLENGGPESRLTIPRLFLLKLRGYCPRRTTSWSKVATWRLMK